MTMKDNIIAFRRGNVVWKGYSKFLSWSEKLALQRAQEQEKKATVIQLRAKDPRPPIRADADRPGRMEARPSPRQLPDERAYCGTHCLIPACMNVTTVAKLAPQVFMSILQALVGTPNKNHGPKPAPVIAVAFTSVALALDMVAARGRANENDDDDFLSDSPEQSALCTAKAKEATHVDRAGDELNLI
jgi:hypothetical protein